MHKRADTIGCVCLAYCINSLCNLNFRTDGLNFTHRHFSSIPSRQKYKGGKTFIILAFGRDRRDRTFAMQESKSCALPLGYIPVLPNCVASRRRCPSAHQVHCDVGLYKRKEFPAYIIPQIAPFVKAYATFSKSSTHLYGNSHFLNTLSSSPRIYAVCSSLFLNRALIL